MRRNRSGDCSDARIPLTTARAIRPSTQPTVARRSGRESVAAANATDPSPASAETTITAVGPSVTLRSQSRRMQPTAAPARSAA